MHSDTTGHEPGTARGAVAIITDRRGEVLMHLRDDRPDIAWPAHWSLLGGGADGEETPTEAIVRELDEEAGLSADELEELFVVRDVHGSGQLITFFAAAWDGDETTLPLAEGVKLQFFTLEHLSLLTIPPFIRDGIHRHLAARPS
ncbi:MULTISPECIES: NUDIX domain-containing protein [unclassified Streptomyces]|uniref:NUDIX domain-containing protein n=1 Tax=unclassified Streptomyces TaxID=2593676 RepID=UPI002E2C3261|nr:NUDIX domain-containing protein [Streptomyces sp. NBC_00223]